MTQPLETETTPPMHELKVWPQYFPALRDGLKSSEFRKDDRQPRFAVGDVLRLREWNPERFAVDGREYTGREVERRVTYVARGGVIPEGFCVMSLEEIPRRARESAPPSTDAKFLEEIRDAWEQFSESAEAPHPDEAGDNFLRLAELLQEIPRPLSEEPAPLSPRLACDHCGAEAQVYGPAQLAEICESCNVGAFRLTPASAPLPETAPTCELPSFRGARLCITSSGGEACATAGRCLNVQSVRAPSVSESGTTACHGPDDVMGKESSRKPTSEDSCSSPTANANAATVQPSAQRCAESPPIDAAQSASESPRSGETSRAITSKSSASAATASTSSIAPFSEPEGTAPSAPTPSTVNFGEVRIAAQRSIPKPVTASANGERNPNYDPAKVIQFWQDELAKAQTQLVETQSSLRSLRQKVEGLEMGYHEDSGHNCVSVTPLLGLIDDALQEKP